MCDIRVWFLIRLSSKQKLIIGRLGLWMCFIHSTNLLFILILMVSFLDFSCEFFIFVTVFSSFVTSFDHFFSKTNYFFALSTSCCGISFFGLQLLFLVHMAILAFPFPVLPVFFCSLLVVVDFFYLHSLLWLVGLLSIRLQ